MPPSRKSSSSRSSRSSSSRSSSSRSRSSSRRSTSSHSSTYGSSYRSSSRIYDRDSSAATPRRIRRNQPTSIPSHIKTKSVVMRCKNHDYLYVHDSWKDKQTGVLYKKGYYDEDGRYYNADKVAFKKPDGSYEAHYVCEYCGTELEANWEEGFYPTCKNCGAEMNKTPVYIDEIVNIRNLEPSTNKSQFSLKQIDRFDIARIGIFAFMIGIFIHLSWISIKSMGRDNLVSTSQVQVTETNLDIYGNTIYLDEVAPNMYSICTKQDEYEKIIIWDYDAEAYYDYDSDCYLWYNTYVSPNLWQYWYDDIAGNDYYGWMECEGSTWYIEVSETEWEKYEGDTSKLWHIKNSFD